MTVLLICKTKQMFEKALPFSNEVWYYKSKANICSENMFDIRQGGKSYEKYSRYHTGNEKKREP